MTINDIIKHQRGFSNIQSNRNRNRSNKMDFILIKVMILIETREEVKTMYCVSHLCILEYCSTHSIKINYIFKVYEEPVEIVPEEEEPVPVVEEEEPIPVVEKEEPVPVVEEVEPEAPPPAGTRQDSLNGRIDHLIFYVYYLSCLRQTSQSSISFFNI